MQHFINLIIGLKKSEKTSCIGIIKGLQVTGRKSEGNLKIISFKLHFNYTINSEKVEMNRFWNQSTDLSLNQNIPFEGGH